MWNAIQGAAGNFANRASKLAVEVLDAGPPEQLRSHGRSSTERETTSSPAPLNDRLSALKARYKSDTTSPRSRDGIPEESALRGEPIALPSSLEESSEVVRLRDQLERLKAEMLHQSTSADETLRQQRFEWAEKIKDMEAQHKNEMHRSRQEITSHFQGLLHTKEQELQSLQHAPLHEHEGENSAALLTELQQKSREVEELKQQVTNLQQTEINEAFGLAQENGDTTQELQQLRQEYGELMSRYHALEVQNAELIPTEKLTERDAFWQGELQQLEASHRKALSELQEGRVDVAHSAEELMSLKSELEQSRHLCQQEISEKEKLHAEKQKSAEEVARLQQSLEERDAIWQQELISSQKDLQDLRKQYEAVRRELTEVKERHAEVEKSHEDLQKELQNELELRSAAEARVRSLQKGMMDINSDASSLKQQLADAQRQLQSMRQSYEQRIQQDTAAYEAKISSLQEEKDAQAESLHAWSIRLEGSEKRRAELEVELQGLTSEDRPAADSVDVAKLTYDLETAAENLKLAESRNSILGHEVESLTQELEQLRLHQETPAVDASTDTENTISQLRKVESERDSCREQLKRLKQQMIQMQEDQEASLHWRIDAEVKLALEDFKKKFNTEGGSLKSEVTALQQELELMQEERKKSSAQMEQKDAELMNLQIALGELTYHGEAADKLRRDLRSAQEHIQTLKDEILDSKAAAAEATSARRAAESSADEAHKCMAEQTDKIHQLENDLFTVKKDLLDASQQLRRIGNNEGSMVDRRLVVQLLVAYLEKRHEKDALDVMARTLGFTEDEKRSLISAGSGRGLFGSVAGGTLALVKGGMSVATFGLLNRGLKSEAGSQLADQWVEFLTKETNPLDQEDPLSYLQKGARHHHTSSTEDRESTRMTSSEASMSLNTIPRSEEAVGKRLMPGGLPHQPSPTFSSRSEGRWSPVLNPAAPSQILVPDHHAPPRMLNPMPKTSMPSFKDFMERQKDTQSDS